MNKRHAITLLISAAAFVAFTTACKDPAKDVPAAEVTPAEQIDPIAAAGEGAHGAEAAAADNVAAADSQAAGSQPAAEHEGYAITPENSSIEFTGSKVTGSHDGGFRVFSGTLTTGAAVTDARANVEIQMSSVFADVDRLTGHLQTGDFFDVETFPTSTFTINSITEGGEGDATHTVTGNLTLHGVAAAITFPATVAQTDTAFTANAEFSINRRSFGINYDGRADDLIRDNVVLRLRLNIPLD